MQNLRFLFILTFLIPGLVVKAQDRSIIQEYIDTYKEIAIAEMQRTGVPASIKLAQGIHETMAGTSVLVRKSNNHFGIKCKANWTGPSVSHDDDARGECFRKYESSDQSYRDHSDFLKNSSRYASLFKLDPLDYAGWANGLKKAGYATNPKYPQIIIRLVKEYNLQDYTLIAMGRQPLQSEQLAKNNDEVEIKAQQAVLVNNSDEPVAQKDQPAFPSGEFTINSCKVIFVPKGTSYFSIAQQYDISLSKLFEYNDMEESEETEKDQLIFLVKKKKQSQEEFHIVNAGEDLHYISQLKGVRLEDLLEKNNLEKDMKPLAGTKIYLNGKAPSRPALSLLASNGSNEKDNEVAMKGYSASSRQVIHVVKSKETIYSIAKRYQVTMGQIVEWNRLQGHTLHIGQELKIYK